MSLANPSPSNPPSSEPDYAARQGLALAENHIAGVVRARHALRNHA